MQGLQAGGGGSLERQQRGFGVDGVPIRQVGRLRAGDADLERQGSRDPGDLRL